MENRRAMRNGTCFAATRGILILKSIRQLRHKCSNARSKLAYRSGSVTYLIIYVVDVEFKGF